MSTDSKKPKTSGIDARYLVVPKEKVQEPSKAESVDCKDAALEWFNRDFDVIPLTPASKVTAVKWDPWLDGLSRGKITDYWTKHPDHELGFIVGDECLVLDADSPEALSALYQIEKAFDISSNLIIKTTKGEHHYYRLVPNVKVKSDSHSTEKHPERIDVKTGRALVVLPPSTGKSVLVDEVNCLAELVEVGQEFVDAIFRHNGRTAPSEVQPPEPTPLQHTYENGELTRKVSPLLEAIDPDSGHDDWIRVGMALHNESGGSDEGLTLFDGWSAKGSKYPGAAGLRCKWNCFNGHTGGSRVTLGTIIKLARDNGEDTDGLLADFGEAFEVCETTTVEPSTVVAKPSIVTSLDENLVTPPTSVPAAIKDITPGRKAGILQGYSLNGMGAELAQQLEDEVFVLDPIALRGQATAIYAPPNAGKTLITLKLLIGSITTGRIQGDNVFYINVDDTLRGLTEKLAIAEEYGFHMIGDGHRGFAPSNFTDILTRVCETGQARGTIVVLDTLKKFADLMDKRRASAFTALARKFVMEGGTLIGLAHVNKKRGEDGKLIHAGTTDLIDDLDCAYVMDVRSHDKDTGLKTVEFINKKRRGSVEDTAVFSYRVGGDGDTYEDMLDSVRPIMESEAATAKLEAEAKDDDNYIQVVEARIREGGAMKKDLIRALQQNTILSKNKAIELIDKYSRPDSIKRLWGYSTVERGGHVFFIMERDEAATDPTAQRTTSPENPENPPDP